MHHITLITDFGGADGFTGVLKGVIAGICPGARVTDIAHDIPRGDIIHAAYVLRNAYLYFPPGTVHLVVVDPGVGGKRRAIAAGALAQYFVAPDNGVLAWVLRELESAAEPIRAWSLEEERFHLEPVSRTFHGRDVFAPAAAFLACGVDPAELGPELKGGLPPGGELSGGPVVELLPKEGDPPGEGRIIHIDAFGNCITTIPVADLSDASGGSVEVETKNGTLPLGGIAPSYESVGSGEPVALEGSSGLLEIAVNGGHAAAKLGIRRGAAVRWRGESV